MIHCVLRGHDYKNEVQVTAQMFFSGAKFSFGEIVGNSDFFIESFFENGAAVGVVYENGAEVSRHGVELPRGAAAYLNERRVVMLSLYHALQKVVPTYTPWGALTGIRPSKLVREWLDGGCTDEEITARLTDPFCVSEEKARLALAVAHAEKRVERRIKTTLGIYVSVPFCPSRCVYCSFNTSHKPAKTDFLERYVNAVIAECRQKSEWVSEAGAKVSSVYIGGGTPTFLPEYLLEKLLSHVREGFEYERHTPEFTVEAGRPDTLTPAKIKILQKYGVTRVAVNPQTLNDSTLAAIGRAHTAEDFFAAFRLARDAGFVINTDIIAGLPGETADDMRRSMDALAALAPENITIHTLALKRASRMNEERPAPIAPCTVENMLSIAADTCAQMGLSPYYLYRQKNMAALLENVGYSLPDHECLYNVGMMAEVQTILGIGAGAVTKYILGTKITREFNPKDPELYIKRREKLYGG